MINIIGTNLYPDSLTEEMSKLIFSVDVVFYLYPISQYF